MIQDTMLSVSVVFGQEWSAAPVVTSKVSRAAGNFYSRNLDERVREQLAIWANTENTACLRNAPPHCSASASITQRRGLCPVWLVLFCCSVLFPPGSLLVSSFLLHFTPQFLAPKRCPASPWRQQEKHNLWTLLLASSVCLQQTQITIGWPRLPMWLMRFSGSGGILNSAIFALIGLSWIRGEF